MQQSPAFPHNRRKVNHLIHNFVMPEMGQCDESAGEPVSGWISAAIMPLEPGP